MEEYIANFTWRNAEVKAPSLNYFKAKYQFHILCYLHDRNYGIDKGLATIKEYLNYFKLALEQADSNDFYNRLAELKEEEKIIVK